MEQAASYVNAWIISGFSYASLWDRCILAGMIWSRTMFRVASNEHLLSQKKVSKDELPKVRISSMSSFSSKSSPGSLEPAGS